MPSIVIIILSVARNAKRFKKKPVDPRTTLTMEDLRYLERNTRYSEKEIREWFR